jgi:hypothetical protein
VELSMRKHIVRSSALWGLVAVGYHLVLSLPFFFLSPMATIPAHSGVIGWIWVVLEFPEILVYDFLFLVLMGFGMVGMEDEINIFGRSPTGEYATFVVLATFFWFLFGGMTSFVVRLIRMRRGKDANGT